MADEPALPEVVLLEPPAIVAGADSAVEVHLSAPPPADPPTCLAIFDNDQPLPATPLAPQSQAAVAVVRTQIGTAAPSVISVSVSDEGGRGMGPKAVVLALPEPVCEELCGLFREAVDHVRNSTTDYQCRFLGLSIAEIGALNSADLDTRIRRTVWRQNFQQLSKDMAAFLRHLWSHPDAELPDNITSDLHRLLQYLMKNKAWEAVSFLLRTGLESGVSIAVCGSVLSEQDMQPDSLQAMAERLWRAFGTDDPDEG